MSAVCHQLIGESLRNAIEQDEQVTPTVTAQTKQYRKLTREPKMPKSGYRLGHVQLMFMAALTLGISSVQAAEIVHDAEYYILEAQNGEVWAVEDGKLV